MIMDFIICILLVPIISSVLLNSRKYLIYHKVYKKLQSYKWYTFENEIIYNYKFEDRYKVRDKIIIFKDGSIQLKPGHYIYNMFWTYLDLYSLYWYLKYKRYIKNNIDINNLEKW